MNIEEMVAESLKLHGYDGLFSEEECACLLDDLMPCEQPSEWCQAGYRKECDNKFDFCPCNFHIEPEK